MNTYPVILCGGAGTRLWPASRSEHPKQFLSLLSERSLFQSTVARFEGLHGAQAPIIVAGAAHVDLIQAQLARLGVEGTVVVEPAGRDSAPAIAAAAALIASRDPEGVAVVVASDHHIPDAEAFLAAVRDAVAVAAKGYVVTFGVRPLHPATAYGYIAPGEVLSDAVLRVSKFIEKPDVARASALLEEGALWNSGNFVFRADHFLAEMDLHAPGLVDPVRRSLDDAKAANGRIELSRAFLDAPKISIDYAVIEKTRSIAVLPVSFDWSDVGAWDAVWSASPHDPNGNAVVGDAVLVDSEDCLVRADGRYSVAALGLKRIGIIAAPDAVLVCDLDAAQGVKGVAERFAVERRPAPEPDAAETLTQWMFTSALPLWWSLGADHRNGGFFERLNDHARPERDVRRLRVQARQIFVYATAGELGWTGPWKAAVAHGLDYLLRRYRRPDGLFRLAVDADGGPASEETRLYEHAFVMLALCAAHLAFPEREDLPVMARELRDRALALHRHPTGGFRETRDDSPFMSDPQMHLFEASLAWVEAGGDAAWGDLADELAAFALSTLIDPATGAIQEVYDETWSPAPGASGGELWPGHQFEWAWLLDRWGKLRRRSDAQAAVQRLYANGMKGIDPTRGVAIFAMTEDFNPLTRFARLWAQTEWLRAAAALGKPDVDQAARAVRAYLSTPVNGLWRDRMEVDGGLAVEPAPASSFYHVAGAIKALKLAADARPRP